MFKCKENTSTTVKVLQRCLPDVIIHPDALTKMQLFVENCEDEIGWLGTATKSKNTITIHDVFLFDQEVHSTTTEITPEGLGEFAETLLQEPDGIEVWNNLKVWGHSHVNMSVFPSGQDDSQMETFADSGHDWFIRIIANKQGDLRVDLYSFELGIIYNDLPWKKDITEKEWEIEEQIKALHQLLEEIKTGRIKKFEDAIKKEMNKKVRKKSYTTVRTITIPTVVQDMETTTEGTTDGGKKKTNETNETKRESESNYTDYQDTINTEEDVYFWFDKDAILDIGECTTLNQVEETIEMYGYNRHFFDVYEKRIIWETGRRLVNHVYFGHKL